MSKKSIFRRKLIFTYYVFYSIHFRSGEKVKQKDDKEGNGNKKKPNEL